MNTFLSLLLAFVPLLAVAENTDTKAVDPAVILETVRSRFPADAVSISGTITVRRRRGVVVREMGFEVDGTWSARGADLKCVVSDAFGRENDSVSVSFKNLGAVSISRKGDGLVADNGAIKGTALNCADLAMPFLWWPNASAVSVEKSRGRECYILDLRPEKTADATRVRVWIDTKMFVVLKAEVYGVDKSMIKQVTVKSFKKIDDQWMIKDLEVIAESSADKTVVTVDSMESAKERSEEGGG